MKRIFSVFLAVIFLASTFCILGLNNVDANSVNSGQVYTGNVDMQLINDSSSAPVISLISGGLNLLGADATKVVDGKTELSVKNFNGNDPVSQLGITIPSDYSDFRKATAIQMYVNNTSNKPIAFTWVRIDDNENYNCTTMHLLKNGEWVKAYSTGGENKYNWYDPDGVVWTKVYADDSMYIPAKYEGLIKIELNPEGCKTGVKKINLSIVIPSDTKPTVYFDDLSILYEEKATSLRGSWSTVGNTGMNINFADGGIATFDNNITGNTAKLLFNLSESLNLGPIKSINMYLENNTGLPLSFYEVSAKAAVKGYGTNPNISSADSTENGYYSLNSGELWTLTHNAAEAPLKVKNAADIPWSDAETTATGSTGSSVLTIPKGFKGYVSIPLTNAERAYGDKTTRNTDGIALLMSNGYNTGSNTPNISDYAGKSFVIRDITAVSADGLAGSWKSVEDKNYGLTYDLDGTITITKNATTQSEKMLFTFNEEQDLYYVENISFNIENKTGYPLCFYDASANAKENDGTLETFSHNFTTQKFYVKAEGKKFWSAANTTNYSSQSKSVLTIPKNFKGEVRLSLSREERSNPEDGSHRISRGFALMMSLGKPGGTYKPSQYVNKQIVITNIQTTVDRLADLYPAPDAPSGINGVGCTTKHNNDGQLTGVSDKMEYRIQGGTWTAVPEGVNVITNLVKGVYEVRLKEVKPYPAGESVKVTISAYVPLNADDYIIVKEAFEDDNTLERITGVEYMFLGGADWFRVLNENNQTAAVNQVLTGNSGFSFQKTLITTKLGDLTYASHVQMYVNYTGVTPLEITGIIDASRTNAEWYNYMCNTIDGWKDSDEGQFWRRFILIQGNTGALAGSADVKDMYYQDTEGKWVKAELGSQGAILPEAYNGYIRFVVPESLKREIKFGFGFQLFDPTDGSLDGKFTIDDIALVIPSEEEVEGSVLFEEYILIKGNGFTPPVVEKPDSKPEESTSTPEISFGFDDDEFVFGDDDLEDDIFDFGMDDSFEIEDVEDDKEELEFENSSATDLSKPVTNKNDNTSNVSSNAKTEKTSLIVYIVIISLLTIAVAAAIVLLIKLAKKKMVISKTKKIIIAVALGVAICALAVILAFVIIDVVKDGRNLNTSSITSQITGSSTVDTSSDNITSDKESSNIDSSISSNDGSSDANSSTDTEPEVDKILGSGYNYKTDKFYNKAQIYSTWINVWYGSTESWYNRDKYTEYVAKVNINGKYVTPDNNSLSYRKEVFSQAKEAKIDALLMDLTNGYQGWTTASKSYQQMCYENGMKFGVAVHPKGVQDIEQYCKYIWETYAGPGIATYSSAYLYKDGKPLIVLYCTPSEYESSNNSNGYYRNKFTLTWASGENSKKDKWGWQLVPQDGPQLSNDTMFATCSISWNTPFVSEDSWRKSLAWLDFTWLAVKEMNPRYVVAGMIDDFDERNGWMKANTEKVVYTIPEIGDTSIPELGRGLQTKDIYGNFSEDVYYNRVKSWIAGNAKPFNNGGIIADGAYTIKNLKTDSYFGADRPQPKVEPATDVGVTLKRDNQVSTAMETYYWFYYLGNDEYSITKLTSGLMLETENDKLVQQYIENKNTQRWTVKKLSDGSFQIINKSTGKAITDNGGSNTDITLSIQNTSDSAQKWTLTPVSGRTMK